MKHSDMHVHTKSSPDADLSASELCRMGSRAGLERIGFVAHLDLHPGDFCYGGFNEQDYMEELDRAEELDEVTVLRGLEIGEPHRFSSRTAEMYSPEKYDFITGALHWLGDSMILGEQPFMEQDPLQLMRRYYQETLEMLEGGGFNILAHMGVFRRGMARAGMSCDIDEVAVFPELLRDVLKKAIETGIAIEVNTSGLRRPEGTTYPTPAVLRMYRELGGRMVTLGSDTHKPGNAFFGLSEGEAILRETGFREYGLFRHGRYIKTPLQ